MPGDVVTSGGVVAALAPAVQDIVNPGEHRLALRPDLPTPHTPNLPDYERDLPEIDCRPSAEQGQVAHLKVHRRARGHGQTAMFVVNPGLMHGLPPLHLEAIAVPFVTVDHFRVGSTEPDLVLRVLSLIEAQSAGTLRPVGRRREDVCRLANILELLRPASRPDGGSVTATVATAVASALGDSLPGVVGKVRLSSHVTSSRTSDCCRGICLQGPISGDFDDPSAELRVDPRNLVRTSGSSSGARNQYARKADLVARLVDDRLQVPKVPCVPFKECELAHDVALTHHAPGPRDCAYEMPLPT